jgi:hypothetical protein
MTGATYAGRSTPRLDLGAALSEHVQGMSENIGALVAPITPVDLKAGTYAAITRESTTRVVSMKRAPKAGYQRDSIVFEDKAYATEEYGLEDPVDDSDARNWSRDFDLKFESGRVIAEKLMRGHEMRVAAAVFNTTTFTGSELFTDVSGSAPWSAAGSDVQAAVRAAKQKIRTNSGLRPNTLVINDVTLDHLRANTILRGAFQYTAFPTDEALTQVLASWLDVERVLVGSAVYNSADEGLAFSGARIWSNLYAMLCYTGDQSLARPSLARTMLWREDSPNPIIAEEYRDERVRGDVLRVRHNTGELIQDPYFGHLLKIKTA